MKKLILLLAIFFANFCNAQTWLPLGTGADSVQALTVYNGSLIAGGSFDSAGGISAKSIASWNGTTWDSLEGGMHYAAGYNIYPDIVYTVSAFNGNLYAGGFFTYAGNSWSDHFAEWNGTTWDSLGPIETSCAVCSITNYNGYLILGGEFVRVGWIDARYIAMWDGTYWASIGSGVNGIVSALTVYNGKLIAAGSFDSADGAPCRYIAQWDGSSWSSLGSGMDAPVYSLTVFNGKLYAGGTFDSAGGKLALFVAEWNGTSWSALGNGLSRPVLALTVYDSALIAGGYQFVAAWKILHGILWEAHPTIGLMLLQHIMDTFTPEVILPRLEVCLLMGLPNGPVPVFRA